MEPKIDVTTIDWHVLYFLRDVADVICNESELKGMARSLLYDVSILEANLRKWPDKFDWIVLLTLVTWYKRTTGTIQVKVETLRRAFQNIGLEKCFNNRLECHKFQIPRYPLPGPPCPINDPTPGPSKSDIPDQGPPAESAPHWHPSTPPQPVTAPNAPVIDVLDLAPGELDLLQALANATSTPGELLCIASALDFDISTIEEYLAQWPQKFSQVVLHTLVNWYSNSDEPVPSRIEVLKDAYSEVYLGVPFSQSLNSMQSSIPGLSPHPVVHIVAEPLDESVGPAVQRSIDVISGNHLDVLYLLFRKITTPQELLTIASTCGMEPRGTIQDAFTTTPMKIRCAHIFLPWFAFESLDALPKYLRLKFGFMKASRLPPFNSIMNEA